MSALETKCPPEAVLSDFGLGKLDTARAETVSQHLETCDDCRQRVASLSGDSFVGRLRQAGGAVQPASRRDHTYVPGESIANMANSTDGAEDGLPRPPRKSNDAKLDGLGSPSSVSAPPELANHPDYEFSKQLGQGGMGTVYLVRNRMMDRMEVLKVISKALLDRPGALERFQQEIRSAAKLNHPNIVAAYRVLRLGDSLVFAMEYVAGRDLAQVVGTRGYLPVVNGAVYGHQVALGLQHAFEKGMVHRDIKPSNLMLLVEGNKHTIKILDFGLARATSEKAGETGLTKSGQMLGTPDYVAPEQVLDARKADVRADLYSLGCTLYFLLSGRPPFQANSLYEILEAHRKREAKPLNLVRADVSVELASVVAKMMAKDPAKRFQTPVEVANALAPFFKQRRSRATPPLADEPQVFSASDTVPGVDVAAPAPPITPPPLPVPLRKAIAQAAPLPRARLAEELNLSISAERRASWQRGRWSSRSPRQKTLAVVLAGLTAVALLGAALILRGPQKAIPDPAVVKSADAPAKLGPEDAGELTRSDKSDVTESSASDGKVEDEPIPSTTRSSIAAENRPSTPIAESDDPEFAQWLQEVQALSAEEQVEAVTKRLTELNPGFDGQATPKIENGVVTELKLAPDKLRNIAPVRALTQLRRLDCAYKATSQEGRSRKGVLTDLSPLAGMGLSELDCFCTNVHDLSPLKGVPLTKLNVGQTHVADLSVLEGMPLVELYCCISGVSDLSPLRGTRLTTLLCGATTVEDLTPLQDLPLTFLHLHGTEVTDLTPLKGKLLTKLDLRLTGVSDLSPLRGMPLTQLWCSDTKVADLSPLKGMPLSTLSVDKTLVTDLSPLRELPLESLNCDLDAKRDAEIVRAIKSLATINNKPAADFWQELGKQP